jgi:formylglycine-generating enzyme required for sulfatase activity
MPFPALAISLASGLLTVLPAASITGPTAGEPVQAGPITVTLVKVPAGTFTMGTDASDLKCLQACLPAHPVTLSHAFWLGAVPVTQGQWQTVMGNNPSRFKLAGADAPVEQVSWNDAQAFIAKLNTVQSAWTFRLPTEAEWEYACRAGDPAESYGSADAIAWHRLNSNQTSHPVGQLQPNAFGLYDMLGNVCQWCQDWYGEYSAAPASDPQGPAQGEHRVYRGSGWNLPAAYARAAIRGRLGQGDNFRNLGLRLCATPGQKPAAKAAHD